MTAPRAFALAGTLSLALLGFGCGSSPKEAGIRVNAPGPASREVSFTGADGVNLKGTLLLPEGKNLPAVLLLPGSGPTDRNGNQPPRILTDLLKQVADRLAAEGIATLRFDKRATPGYASLWPKKVKALNEFFAWDKFVDDAKAALNFLQKQPEINPKRTGIIGHSEGSGLAIQIGHDLAGKPNSPQALILIGAPGRTLKPIIREQVAASLKRAKADEAMIKTYMDYVDAAILSITTKGTVPPNPPQGLEGLFNPTAVTLMQAYFHNDPSVTVKAYRGAVLIVQGDKDIQVSAERDTPLLEIALASRGKTVQESYIVPLASHNLKVVADPQTELGLAGPVVPEALDKIVEFLKKNMP